MKWSVSDETASLQSFNGLLQGSSVGGARRDQMLARLSEQIGVYARRITQWKVKLVQRAAEVLAEMIDKHGPARLARVASQYQPVCLDVQFYCRRAQSRRYCKLNAKADPNHRLPLARPVRLLDLMRSSVLYLVRVFTGEDFVLVYRIDGWCFVKKCLL